MIKELLKPGTHISINMFANTLTVDGALVEFDKSILFNCNWSDETILEILEHKSLYAECHNVSSKSKTDKVSLNIYEYVLIKTENNECISVGFYHE